MKRFLLARLRHALLVALGVATLVFLLIHLIPGDPVDVMLGESAVPADKAELRHALKLDRPLRVKDLMLRTIGNDASSDTTTTARWRLHFFKSWSSCSILIFLSKSSPSRTTGVCFFRRLQRTWTAESVVST